MKRQVTMFRPNMSFNEALRRALDEHESYPHSCPCCGAEADAIEQGVSYIVRCVNCGLRTTECLTKGEAIKKWNKRVESGF